eukprot:CAMPEP_0115049754 /NCGR_PEP_ID=MMETSP0227-20121206/1390_1 /TAXON_ID=89957 /ORGANISM="Polarella glacialis, Strain CCMP 1383" /LENGTH=113 /DNA_ID=CAMNT_0002433505 /DNA_START=507 /DNA_END=849 /DNA_ORIENTATION=+
MEMNTTPTSEPSRKEMYSEGLVVVATEANWSPGFAGGNEAEDMIMFTTIPKSRALSLNCLFDTAVRIRCPATEHVVEPGRLQCLRRNCSGRRSQRQRLEALEVEEHVLRAPPD